MYHFIVHLPTKFHKVLLPYTSVIQNAKQLVIPPGHWIQGCSKAGQIMIQLCSGHVDAAGGLNSCFCDLFLENLRFFRDFPMMFLIVARKMHFVFRF